MPEKKFAVLIDAENISHKYLKIIFDEITNEGIVTYKRMYADWTTPDMQKYREHVLEFAITPIQQYRYTKGKNSTDSAMIIDAMDILYSGNVDGFCLVSSDSDFTKLATRLRESGMMVIGMGEMGSAKQSKTPQAFVVACNTFKYLDILAGSVKQETEKTTAGKKNKAKTEPATVDYSKKPDYIKVKNAMEKIIDEQSDDEGWIIAHKLGDLVKKKIPDFDPRNFGCKKFVDLVEKMGFETRKEPDLNNKQMSSSIVYVRKKQ